jgi:hypothetical protein
MHRAPERSAERLRANRHSPAADATVPSTHALLLAEAGPGSAHSCLHETPRWRCLSAVVAQVLLRPVHVFAWFCQGRDMSFEIPSFHQDATGILLFQHMFSGYFDPQLQGGRGRHARG